jgi:hypothetical protein
VVQGVENAAHVGLYPIAIGALVQVEGQVPDRIERAPSRSIAIAAREEVLLINRRQPLGTGELDPFIFQGRNP